MDRELQRRREHPDLRARGADPGYHNHTVEEVATAASFLPKASRAIIARIQLNPITNPQDPFWAAEYKAPDFHSYMTAGMGGVVTIYPDKVATPLQGPDSHTGALIAETGHTWAYRTWGLNTSAGKWLAWKAAMAKDNANVSGYATNAIVEIADDPGVCQHQGHAEVRRVRAQGPQPVPQSCRRRSTTSERTDLPVG